MRKSGKPDLRGPLHTPPSRRSRTSGAPLRYRSRCTASGTRAHSNGTCSRMSAKREEGPPALKDLSTHFAFGQNWASYSTIIDEARVAQAERGLVRLLGEG